MFGADVHRRNFLKMTLAAAAGLSLGGPSRAAAPARKPNVLLIVSDDQGSIDLHCYGAADLHTPNLDRLAQTGVRFTQFYSAAPVCAPARGALLTGRYPRHNGIVNNGNSFKPDETTLAERLQGAGYRTAAIGKWHMGMKTGGPNREGFDTFFGHRGGCIENYRHNVLHWDEGTVSHHDLWRNDTEVREDGTHFGELVVRESVRFLEENRDRPFFLYVAFNNPHYPVQPLPQHVDRFKALPEPRRSYAAFVATLDDQIGRILAALQRLNLHEHTLVIFLADQGHSVESRNALFVEGASKDNAGGGSAGPFRGHKFTVWEGGIRVPCIFAWPGTLPQNATRTQVATSMDIFPTVAGYAGAVRPGARPPDGTSIAAVLQSADAPSPHTVLHWEAPGMWAVREGRWKLVSERNTLFLGDLEADAGERRNLAPDHPDVVARLRQLHEDWSREMRNEQPVRNP